MTLKGLIVCVYKNVHVFLFSIICYYLFTEKNKIHLLYLNFYLKIQSNL